MSLKYFLKGIVKAKGIQVAAAVAEEQILVFESKWETIRNKIGY